jgi:hypothetical protein
MRSVANITIPFRRGRTMNPVVQEFGSKAGEGIGVWLTAGLHHEQDGWPTQLLSGQRRT